MTFSPSFGGEKVFRGSMKKTAVEDDMSNEDNCLFCRIVKGQIPSRKVYEDEQIYAFHDINPVAQVHFMIIPKQHIASLMEAEMEHRLVLGHILAKAHELARSQGLKEGFRTVINSGRIGMQEVYHLHAHILGGTEPLGAMLKRSLRPG
jgi:histidine triad (HIT) family protein